MIKESIAGILLILGFLMLAAYFMTNENRRRKKFRLNQIKESFGKLPEREYSSADFESIPKYAQRVKGDRFYIDDITWNDLDMDSVFMMINQTESACGEDYLYAKLRIPRFKEEDLLREDAVYRYFDEHDAERIKIAYELSAIGKMKDISVIEHIYRMDEVEKASTIKYKLSGLLSLLSVVTLLIQPIVGLILIFCALGVTLYMHGKATENKIEHYMYSLSGVLRMIATSKKIAALNIPELSEYSDRLSKDAEALLRLQKKAKLIVTKKGYQDMVSGVISGLLSFFCIDILSFYQSLDEYKSKKDAIADMIKNLGIIDSSIAIASFRRYLPFYSKPELTSEKVRMEAGSLYHMLVENPVANSVSISGGTLITGSNASGKSTFIKSLAINAILAQTIYTSLSTYYRSCFLKVMTSMSLEDNVLNGESYYIVEIKSIKRILDEAKKGAPMLCIVDEVLRGTNTIERIGASSEILSQIAKENVMIVAATHDIELTYILENRFTNYHFEEEITDDDVIFNYILQKGRTVSRNAIALLTVLGYPKDLIEGAKAKVENFENTGKWKIESADESKTRGA